MFNVNERIVKRQKIVECGIAHLNLNENDGAAIL